MLGVPKALVVTTVGGPATSAKPGVPTAVVVGTVAGVAVLLKWASTDDVLTVLVVFQVEARGVACATKLIPPTVETVEKVAGVAVAVRRMVGVPTAEDVAKVVATAVSALVTAAL
jgi:hypothetical protein